MSAHHLVKLVARKRPLETTVSDLFLRSLPDCDILRCVIAVIVMSENYYHYY